MIIIKTYCKNVSILDMALIKRAVVACLDRKKYRSDVAELLLQHRPTKEELSLYRQNIKQYDYAYTESLYDNLARRIQKRLKNKNTNIKAIKEEIRFDVNANKNRTICIQTMEQQVLDYIAIFALEPFLKRIGEYQIAGIKGRGNDYGRKTVLEWLRHDDSIYFVKGDINKCYQSVDREKLMNFIKKYIKNKDLIWLIDFLTSTYSQGLSIGSLLSQFLCNVYLSQLYHYMKETVVINNHHLKYMIMQMDDIVLIHDNKEELKYFYDKMIDKLNELGLTLKTQEIYKIQDRNGHQANSKPIDLVGFLFYKDGLIRMRKTTFKRLHRTLVRVHNDLITKGHTNINRARRLLSQWGMFDKTDSYNFKQKYIKDIDYCKKLVSIFDKQNKKLKHCHGLIHNNIIKFNNWKDLTAYLEDYSVYRFKEK